MCSPPTIPLDHNRDHHLPPPCRSQLAAAAPSPGAPTWRPQALDVFHPETRRPSLPASTYLSRSIASRRCAIAPPSLTAAPPDSPPPLTAPPPVRDKPRTKRLAAKRPRREGQCPRRRAGNFVLEAGELPYIPHLTPHEVVNPSATCSVSANFDQTNVAAAVVGARQARAPRARPDRYLNLQRMMDALDEIEWPLLEDDLQRQDDLPADAMRVEPEAHARLKYTADHAGERMTRTTAARPRAEAPRPRLLVPY